MQRAYWLEDGTPFLGTAAEYNDLVKTPSGTNKAGYIKLEAEDAVLTGLSSTETYNSSGNACVYGFTDESKSAEFTFDVAQAGEYMLYLGASANVNGAAVKVNVNGQEYEKEVYNFNASSGGRLVVDNWFGYELKVNLPEGSNTVVVTGVSGKETVALDYIEYCDAEQALAPNPEPAEEPEIEEPTEPENPEDPDTPDEPDEPQQPEKPEKPGNTVVKVVVAVVKTVVKAVTSLIKKILKWI